VYGEGQASKIGHSFGASSVPNSACCFSAIRAARRSRAACGEPSVNRSVARRENGKGAYTHLVLDTTRFHLVVDDLGTALLCLRLVDVLHQHTFVLEHITL